MMQPHPSDVPSQFSVVKPLGQGGYGAAFLATRKSTGAQLAVKELRPLSKHERDLALQEAKCLAQLSHPCIVQYYDAFVKGGSVWIAMEFCPNGNMNDYIERVKQGQGQLSERRIAKWVGQACQALRYIHGRGMVHRDVKTHNCFVSDDGSIRLGDFGTARQLDRNHTEVGKRTCSTPVGTPLYMAPELARGGAYGQKADVWGVGCMLYELMTGRPPFYGNSLPRLLEAIKKGRFNKRPPAGYSEELWQLCLDCLAADPDARPTVADMLRRPVLEPGSRAPSAAAAAPTAAPAPAAAAAALPDIWTAAPPAAPPSSPWYAVENAKHKAAARRPDVPGREPSGQRHRARGAPARLPGMDPAAVPRAASGGGRSRSGYNRPGPAPSANPTRRLNVRVY